MSNNLKYMLPSIRACHALPAAKPSPRACHITVRVQVGILGKGCYSASSHDDCDDQIHNVRRETSFK